MFIANFIVGLWFVPVTVFILIPLSMLCVWSVHQLLRKITDKIAIIPKSAEDTRLDGYVSNLRSKPAV
jgi:hypothetical protein